MAYTVTRTNGTNPITIPDGTINTSTSLTLVGKNYPNYGQILDQNFVTLLENSASGNKPASPVLGQIWYDSANRTLKINIDGGTSDLSWKNVGSTTSGPNAPSSNNVGDLWWDTVNGQLLAYDGKTAQYKLVGPIGTTAGISTDPIYDSGGIGHSVIKFMFGQQPIMILSNSNATFTPNVGIMGFNTINPGLNLASSSLLRGAQFTGQSTDSATLQSIAPASFMRADQTTQTTGVLSVLNNNGLYVGASGSQNFHVTTTGGNAAIINETNSGYMNFLVRNSSGTQLDAMDIYPNGNVVANFDFTVAGNISFANTTNDLVITGTSPSYNPSTGALRLSVGGIGVAGNINTGGSQNNFTGGVRALNIVTPTVNAGTIGNSGAVLYGTLNSASGAQTNITSVGTLSSLIVSGSATFQSGVSGAINTAAQTNITSVGTLAGLTATGSVNFASATTVSLGANTNVKITGGSSGQYLVTDGSGNISWASISGVANQVPYFQAGGVLAGSSNLTYNGATFAITGALTTTQDITAFYTSDERLKTDFVSINGALAKVNSLRGVTFAWNDIAVDTMDKDPSIREAGVIAQDVQAVLPEVVTVRDNGYLAVKYEKIVPLLIEAIKELSAEVESLKAKLQ